MKLLLKPNESSITIMTDKGKELFELKLNHGAKFKILNISDKYPEICVSTKIKFVKSFNDNTIFVNNFEYSEPTEVVIVEDFYKPKYSVMVGKKYKKYLKVIKKM